MKFEFESLRLVSRDPRSLPQIDPAEFACLKAIVLFKSDCKSLKDPLQIEVLQDQAQLMLAQHTRIQYPSQPAR